MGALLRRGRGQAAGLLGAVWLLAVGCGGAGHAVTPVGVVVKEAEAAPGYTLFVPPPFRNTGTAYLVDLEGRVAHSWTFPTAAHVLLARLLENGNLMVMTGLGVRELNPDGDVVWDYEAASLHHDFLPLPNGNVLLLMLEKKTAAEVVARGGNPENVGKQDLGVDYVVEVRPTGPAAGEVVWRWSAWEHLIQDFDPGKPDYGVVAEHPELIDLNYRLAESYRFFEVAGRHADWLHVNSLDYNPQLDQIALSARNLGELWIIDHGTTTAEAAGHGGGKGGRGGDLLYRWGNPAAWGGTGEQELYWAHHVQWIKPGLPGGGNVILFNNGAGYPGNRRYHSSVDEVALPVAGAGYRPVENGARQVWRYAADPPGEWYAARRSGVQRLPNGNTLICSSQQGTMFEVTPAGKTVWKYVNPATSRGRLRQGDPMPIDPDATRRSGQEVWSNRVYRAYRYPPDHPGLQELDLSPGETVELPVAATGG